MLHRWPAIYLHYLFYFFNNKCILKWYIIFSPQLLRFSDFYAITVLKEKLSRFFIVELIEATNYLEVFEKTFRSNDIEIRKACAMHYYRQLVKSDPILNVWIKENPNMDTEIRKYVANV